MKIHKKIIIGLLVLIILLLIIIFTINFLKFNKIYVGMNENYKITNFHYIRESDSIRYDITRNDNIIVLKTYSYTDSSLIHTFTFYTNGSENYVFNETDKIYNISEQDEFGSLKFLYTSLEFDSADLILVEKIKMFFNTSIENENQNDTNCYHITKKFTNNNLTYDFYIDTNNYLVVLSNNETCGDYQLNSITSENVAMPNLEEYQLVEK